MLEKNRQQKVYMVQGGTNSPNHQQQHINQNELILGGSGSQQQLQYQRRISAAGGSPANLEPLSAGGVNLAGQGGVAGGYF